MSPEKVAAASAAEGSEAAVAAQRRSPAPHETLGAKAVDLVLAALAHHNYSPPAEPMNLYILGVWQDAEARPN